MNFSVTPETIPPPVPPPRTRRRRPRAVRSINDLTDAEAWSCSDRDICGMLYKNSSGVNSATINQQQEEEESEDEWIPNNRPLQQSADVNSIETYLRTEPVSRQVIKLAGGLLQYWDAQRALVSCSDLARFAIDYLSAPASSVEVERAFSCGRLMTNHLQHQMSPETFQAKMTLRLWYKTPLLWDVLELATVLGDRFKDLVSESPNAHD